MSSKLSKTYWTFYYICKIIPPLLLYSAIFIGRGWFSKDYHHFLNPTLPKFGTTALKIVTVVLLHLPIVTVPHIGKPNSWKRSLKMLFLSFTGYAEQACRTKVLVANWLTINSMVRLEKHQHLADYLWYIQLFRCECRKGCLLCEFSPLY